MKRIKAENKAIARVKLNPEETIVKRVKAGEINTESSLIKRIKPKATRVYNGGFIKDPKTGMLWKDGEFFKLYDGCYFKCWPDGNFKDQKTDTHVCWFGKITRKATPEQLMSCARSVQRAMVRTFPELFYDINTGEKLEQSEDGMRYNHKLV